MRRPVITPDCFAMIRDDEIQRLVSQVRKIEDESAEGGTNKNYKFEIERTDSLEFTRNSMTGENINESRLQDLQSRGSNSSKEGSTSRAIKKTTKRQNEHLVHHSKKSFRTNNDFYSTKNELHEFHAYLGASHAIGGDS